MQTPINLGSHQRGLPYHTTTKFGESIWDHLEVRSRSQKTFRTCFPSSRIQKTTSRIVCRNSQNTSVAASWGTWRVPSATSGRSMTECFSVKSVNAFFPFVSFFLVSSSVIVSRPPPLSLLPLRNVDIPISPTFIFQKKKKKRKEFQTTWLIRRKLTYTY